MEKPLALLADDNEATCTLITALLHKDFEIEVARDGQDAIDKLRVRRYAVVIVDLLMPVVDGYAVLEYLAAEKPETLGSVLVVTASVSSRHMERMSRFPVRRIIPKPFDVDDFLAAVRDCTAEGGRDGRGPLLTSGMILLLADLLRRVPLS